MQEKKIKFYKKSKPSFNFNQHTQIRRWLITGSFNETYFINKDFDRSKIYLVKNIISSQPEIIEKIIRETIKKTLNKNVLIYTLVLLSKDNFKAKKIFSNLFNDIITEPKDLYYFIKTCKKERGFGQLIHNAIKNWFKQQDTRSLEYNILNQSHGYNWKLRDILNLVKLKPIDKNQKDLFKWIMTGELKDKEFFKYLNIYNKLKNKEELNETEKLIFENDFRLSMVPSNYFQDKENFNKFLDHLFKNFYIEDYPLINLPKYLSKLSDSTKEHFKTSDFLIERDLLELLSFYSNISKVAVEPLDIDIMLLAQDALKKKIQSTYSNDIHLLDTNYTMLDGELKYTNTSPAVTSSVMIGLSKNVFDFNGELIGKREFRSIMEAEGFTNKEINYPNYRKIFNSIKNIEASNLIVWTNNPQLDKDRFVKEFQKWKTETNKVMKVMFINLYNYKVKNSGYKEIYDINKNSIKLLELIKEGEI